MTTVSGRTVAVRGAGWTLATALVGIGAQAVFVAVSGRLLTPAAFGVFTAASLGLRLVSYFAQGGVVQALVQRDELTEQHLRAAGLVGLSLALVAAALTGALAHPVARLIGVPGAAAPMAALGGAFLLSALGAQAAALLRRALRFRAIALTEGLAYCLAFLGCGIPAMIAGWGTWSLVVAALAQPLLTTLMQTVAVRRLPRFGHEPAQARQLLRFGGLVSVIGFLEFLSGSVDTTAVARFAGPAGLGQYGRAASLVGVGLNAFTTATSKVLSPLMARASEHQQAGRMTLAATRLVLLPFCVGIAVAFPLSDDAVRLVLGPGWDGTARVLPWYAVGAVMDLSCHFMAVSFEARGLLRAKLRLQLQQLVVVLLVVVTTAVVTRSPAAVAASWAGAEAWRFARYALASRHQLGQPLRPLIAGLGEGVLVALAVYAGVVVVVRALDGAGPLPRVLAGVAVAGVIPLSYALAARRAPWPVLVRSLGRGARS